MSKTFEDLIIEYNELAKKYESGTATDQHALFTDILHLLFVVIQMLATEHQEKKDSD